MKYLIVLTISFIFLALAPEVGETKKEFYQWRSGHFTTKSDENLTRTNNNVEYLNCSYGIRPTCIKYNEKIFEWVNPQEGII